MTKPFVVAGFYRFTPMTNLEQQQAGLREQLKPLRVRGSILLAEEGLNATIAGEPTAINQAMTIIRQLPGCADLEPFISQADAMPFGRLKVRLKREIVTMRETEQQPPHNTNTPPATQPKGQFTDPREWDALLARDDVAVIDLRNDYETAIGTFDGAIDPGLKSFSAFPAWWQANASHFAGKQLAMFCTGGIRCEKAGPYLQAQGVNAIQLKGGILRYLAETPKEQSRWQGACFVFDERVALGHGLEPDGYITCPPCGRAIKLSPNAPTQCACGHSHPPASLASD